MTVHRDKSLVNETNRRTEFQFYWYYEPTYCGQPFCPSSGVLSRTSTLVHFSRFDGSKRSLNLEKYTNADVRIRTPDDGQKGCPKRIES